MTIPSLVFGTLTASMIGLIFHFFHGGSFNRLLVHILTAIIAFFLGHYVGEWTHWHMGRYGTLNFFPSILAALVGLIAVAILEGPEKSARKKRP